MRARLLLVVVACSLASAASHALVPPAPGDGVLIPGLEQEFLGDFIGSGLGISVSVSGDTAVVGAATEAAMKGAAYVYVRNGASWTQQAKLLAPDGDGGDLFGCAVAIAGDTVIVGARKEEFGAGRAHVFVRTGSTWTHQALLKASGAFAGKEFAASVGLSGDTAVVGSPYDNPDGVVQAGSAHVFVRNAGVWSYQQFLEGLDSSFNDFFGASVSISGETLVVGASNEDNEGGQGAGSAYVFTRSGGPSAFWPWDQQQKLTTSDGVPFATFGATVSLEGDTLLVGAPNGGTPGAEEGRAYVFVRQGTTWTEQAELQASDGADNDGFGAGLALSGERAVVGSYGHEQGSQTDAGAAYVFKRSSAVWSEKLRLAAPEPSTGSWFGAGCGLAGDDLVVGTPWHDEPGKLDTGAAYAYTLLECPAATPASEVVRLGTPPNPAALNPGLTSAPLLGAVWDPVIEHSTFAPGAALDLLGVSTTATSIPSPPGTLLCGTAPFLVVASPEPGEPFEISIPLDCAFAGLAFCTQGASVGGLGQIALTNALDIVLGTL